MLIYIGKLSDIQSLASMVQKNAHCLTMKALPKDTAFGVLKLAGMTKDSRFHIFDVEFVMDGRNNSGKVKIASHDVPKVLGISPDMREVWSNLTMIDEHDVRWLDVQDGEVVRARA